jgi:two-component system, chemotaxis family, chemotaxis protein CheY
MGAAMRRLLIVEDSGAMRSLIASILGEMEDVEIVEAGGGFDALKLLAREPVHLLVLDINMPGINGLEILSFVRKNPGFANIRVLIVTTEASEEDRRRAMALGADDFVTKPFEPQALLAIVRRLLSSGK